MPAGGRRPLSRRRRSGAAARYHPQDLPVFCSSSQPMSGWK